MYKITILGIKPGEIKPVLQTQVGQGGFQDLLKKIRDQYSLDREELILYKSDIERLYRYVNKYGLGGFQDRIKVLQDKLDLIKEDLRALIEI